MTNTPENMTMTDFLRRIISPNGVPMGTRILGGKAKNFRCESIEGMAKKIAAIDANEADAFHACAAFQDGESRRGANAKSMQALWLDVDCGREKALAGKGYSTKVDAVRALKAFCWETGLPKPMIVDSGGGLHVYWPLTAPIAADEWKRAAYKLKQLTSAFCFWADPSRTADAASILRPIGSHNKKYNPPREVVLLRDAAPTDYASIRARLELAITQVRSPSPARWTGGKRSLVATEKIPQDLVSQVNPNGYTLEDVETALGKLDPWCERGQWMPVGMALADAFGETARDLFVRWSRGELWERKR